jgi:hypothetical protein
MFASAARQMGVTLPLVLVAIISAHQGYTNPCNELVIGGLVTTGQNIRDAMMGSYRRYGPVQHGGKVVALFAFSKMCSLIINFQPVYVHEQTYVDELMKLHNTTLPNKGNRVFLFFAHTFGMWVVGPTLPDPSSNRNPDGTLV